MLQGEELFGFSIGVSLVFIGHRVKDFGHYEIGNSRLLLTGVYYFGDMRVGIDIRPPDPITLLKRAVRS